jgi:GntR family transcriptional regulator
LADQPRTRFAHLEVSDFLREQLGKLETGGAGRLPTESELTEMFNVSRHTARRAYADLVAQGLVERTPGRGTYPVPARRFLMSIGSVDDLLARPEDRELRVTVPLSPVRDATAAMKLGLPSDDTLFLAYRLSYQDRPFALTQIHLPPHFGPLLADVDFLHKKGGVGRDTVVSILNRKLVHPVAMAKQLITAVAAPEDVAEAIECEAGQPLLKIEYLYFDTDARPVQQTTNFYNSDRYEYRAQLPSDRLPRLQGRRAEDAPISTPGRSAPAPRAHGSA